jgi:23S rRNA pseudouridine1911/1915/1917 synthase
VSQQPLVLFEDLHCIAVVKPAGQFTQGAWAPPGEQSLESELRHYLNPAEPSTVYLGIVHRLDRPTSGVLIWAKTPKAARRLSAQFERRQVVKEYWAIASGPTSPTDRSASQSLAGETDRSPLTTHHSPSAGETDHSPLITRHSPNDRPDGRAVWRDWLTAADSTGVVSSYASAAPGTREAVTRVREQRALSPPDYYWLRLWPETGRTHQLRVQAARRGMPILGDAIYGSTAPFPTAHAIALHARSLRLRHPITYTEMTLVATLPATWADAGIILSEPGESPD